MIYFLLLFNFFLILSCKNQLKNCQIHLPIQLIKKNNLVPKIPDFDFEPIIKKIFDSFIEDARKNNKNISENTIKDVRTMKFVTKFTENTSANTIAICNRFIYEDENNLINWKTIEVLDTIGHELLNENELLLKKVVYHELFHCLMNRGHLPDNVSGIMNAFFKENDNLNTKWDQLVKDMFSDYYMSLMPKIE